jgi:hypothetical protein
LIGRPRRDIPLGAVGVIGRHLERLLGIGRHEPLSRFDGDPRDRRFSGDPPRRAFGDPLQKDVVVIASRRDPHTATVRQQARGLLQQQALLGRCQRNAAAAGVLGQRAVVEIGIEAQKRELKAILPASLAVTCPLIAAPGSQNRLDVELEAHGRLGRSSFERR